MFNTVKGVQLDEYLNQMKRFRDGKNKNGLFTYKPHNILAPSIFRTMFK